VITPKLLRDWNACWTDEKILEKLGKRKDVAPRELATDTTISLDDRLWVLCRAIWYLDEHAARLFAIESALTVAHLAGDEDDQAQFCGLMNELILIEDLPLEQQGAAWDAARGAARGAAWGAAWGAARDAAWGAARDAARDAAWGTPRDAAWGAARDAADAAWGAAWDAARDAADAARDAADAAWDASLEAAIGRALEWLGDYADGWEEES
jgi:hypothetical protein